MLELLLPVCSILHTQFRDFKAKVFKIRLGSILHTQFREDVALQKYKENVPYCIRNFETNKFGD